MERMRRTGRRNTLKKAVAKPRAPFILRNLSTFNVLSEAGLEQIEANADQILSETGMEFHDDPEILTTFADAGCDILSTNTFNATQISQ